MLKFIFPLEPPPKDLPDLHVRVVSSLNGEPLLQVAKGILGEPWYTVARITASGILYLEEGLPAHLQFKLDRYGRIELARS